MIDNEVYESIWAEEAWARSLGFNDASEYHAASDEAFATEQEIIDQPYPEA